MASLTPNPKLREDLVIIRQVIRGEVMYICKIPEPRSYQYFSELQHDLMSFLDGTRSRSEIVEDFNRAHSGSPLDLETLEENLESLGSSGMLERSREEKRLEICKSLRDRRRHRASSHNAYGSIFHLMLPAWNPEKYFDRVIARVRFFWTPGFVMVSAACILIMLVIWVREWDTMWTGTIALFTFKDKTVGDIVDFLIILFIVGFIHESAHGLTCRYFGGNVTQMGFMLVYFTPCFYVDVSDTYLFDRHYKTQWVVYAGCYIELFICSLATFVWALTSDGTFVNDISYKVLLMTGISSIIMNLDPLIKLDGYYSLIDYLEIPDLWERSFEYLRAWIKKTIFRLPTELEPVTRRVRRIFLTYASLSVVYKAALIALFLFFLRNILVSQFGAAGYGLLALAVLLMFRKYFSKLWSFAKFNVLDKREVLMSPRSWALAGAASVLLLGGATLPRLPVSVKGQFLLEPGSRNVVRATENGVLESVFVHEGQSVRKGDMLAILRNEELEGGLRSVRLRADSVAQEIATAMHASRLSDIARKRSEWERLLTEIRVLERRAEALSLRSPIAGVVTTSRLQDSIGSFIRMGEAFCAVSATDGLIARIPVREIRLDEIQPGQSVDLLFTSHPYDSVPGEVIARAPASRWHDEVAGDGRDPEEGAAKSFARFEVIVGLTGHQDWLRPGMSGLAKIQVERATLASRAARAFKRWLGTRVW